MIKQLIAEFRKQNGRHPAKFDHYEEDQNCLWHCLHMARTQDLCHAPEYLRPGKSEACAARSFFRDTRETLRAIVFEQFANSPEHREILLFNDNLACAFYQHQHQLFVTVRAW
jgi:hypothetical protein